MEQKNAVALIELGGSHDECMLSQMRALKAVGTNLTLILSSKTAERCPYLVELADELYTLDVTGKTVGDLKLLNKLVRFLKKKQVQKVMFNTAQGGQVRNLTFLLPKNVTCYGIVHTLLKFEGSFTQKLISRKIHNYLVLSDDLLQRAKKIPGIHVESFYPLDFPHYAKKLEKPEGEIWLTLTGEVESRRKDLSAMLDMIRQTPKQVKFIFLGKTKLDNPAALEFIEQLKSEKLENRVVWFDAFVPADVFDAYLKNTDFLLPLIHPDTPSADQYISNQISGAFLIAFGYKIPMLIHEAYENEHDFHASAFFYRVTDFGVKLREAVDNRLLIKQAIENEPKWQKEFQYEKFRHFLGF